MGWLNCRRKLMVWKTFTFTAWAAISSALAPFPSSSEALPATPDRSARRPSKAQPGAVFSDFLARKVCVAPTIAPHLVWPRTRIRRLPSLPVQNSRLPTMLPSAWVQVLPALRKTKISPGIASKIVSMGARESAQPITAVWGACPDFTKAVRMAPLAATDAGAPRTKRSLPSFSISMALLGSTDSSAPVRTPWIPRLAAPCLLKESMEGGIAETAALRSSACLGDRPMKSTMPVDRS
mmetsp:Transcript_62554/g.139678  ORF Transcript_62554/g.139678 Transcript_62554/m.139678 type:complete len:237 (-) Transcript_62554:605-1315(-)